MITRTGRLLLVASALLVVTGTSVTALLAARPGAQPSPSAAPSPATTRGPLLAAAGAGLAPTPAGLARVLASSLSDHRLGRGVALSVVDVATGAQLVDRDSAVEVLPASTAKIVTAVGVLLGTDPNRRISTRVLAGPRPGEVVLVGGGDPTLAGPQSPSASFGPARLTDLARQVRAALGTAVVTRVLVDDTLFSGPTTGPRWRGSYVTDGDVAPVMALSVDGGRVQPGRPARVADPALAAGAAFAHLLGPTAVASRGQAAPAAAQLGAVVSPPLPVLVEQMLEHSDNDLAEALTRQVALAGGRPASFDAGAQAVAAVLTAFAGPQLAAGVTLVDGSGLSRSDRVRPADLTALLARAATVDRLRPLLTGLPVAGFDGTLAERFLTGPAATAAGTVRAKTGTLDGVSALAGLVVTSQGRLLAFDLTANGVPTGSAAGAEAALDQVAAALASCGCG